MIKKDDVHILIFWVVVAMIIITILWGTMWGWAHFRLWRAEYAGKAFEIEKEYVGRGILAEAEYAKQARIEQAKAEKESAQLTADAIEIVGAAAQKYPEYRTQEFILSFGEALREGNIEQIIYVPTEANIPITEATRLQ
jgi:regulator of protease activity HflC (stomatin/prohibitin superfamily)